MDCVIVLATLKLTHREQRLAYGLVLELFSGPAEARRDRIITARLSCSLDHIQAHLLSSGCGRAVVLIRITVLDMNENILMIKAVVPKLGK